MPRYDDEWRKRVSEGTKKGMAKLPKLSEAEKQIRVERLRKANLGKRKPFEDLKSWKYIKKRVIEEAEEKCERCGWNERNLFHNSILLQVNHKDGDRTNRSRENLEALCPNCHSLTEHFMFYGRNHSNKTKKILKDKFNMVRA